MKTRLKHALMAFATVMISCGFKYSNREGSEIPSDGQPMYNCVCEDGSGGGMLPENILKPIVNETI